MAYKNEEGEMPVTNIGFQMGLWDENGQELNLVAPESMQSAKKHGIDHSKGINAEEKAVEDALVGSFDLADEGAAMLDKAVEEIANFIKRIQVV